MEETEVSRSPEPASDKEEKNVAQLGSKESEPQLGSDTSLNSEDEPEAPEAALIRVLKMSDQMPQKPNLLNAIGDTFFAVFGTTRDVNDINNCVLAYGLAVQLLPETDARLVDFVNDYGQSVFQRYNLTGEMEDIYQAVSSLRKAIQITPERHASLPVLLNNIGGSLETYFKRTGDLAHISEAILHQRKAVQLTPEGHTSLYGRLHNLGNSLQTRFEHTGDIADISEAISYKEKAVQLSPKGHAGLPTRLNSLGVSFKTRFEHTGDLADISEAVSCQRKAVQITPEGHDHLATRLNSLGISLEARFRRTQDLADIAEAISHQQKSVQLTPKGHEDMPSWLNNLGNSLHARFQCTQNLADMSEAISYHQKAVQLTPEDHADLPARLNNLGNMLQTHFDLTGNLADISEAISRQQKAVRNTHEGHADLPAWLTNLGNSLQRRFERTRDIADISEAISYKQKAVKLSPEGHVDLPTLLDNLGSSLHTHFERTEDLNNIAQAISYQRTAVQLTSEGHADMPARLNNLGNSLQTRFEHTHDLADILEAISCREKAVQLSPEGHADMPVLLYNLGYSFQRRFEYTGDLADTSAAITYKQKAVQLIPKGHADLSLLLYNLGYSFQTRFERTDDEVDVANSISHYRQSATSVSGRPLIRLAAAKAWAYWTERMDKSQSLEAYRTVILLISQVAGLGQTIQNRYTNLVDTSELSSSAAAAAIELGQHSLALEWLEQGRCLVWNQLNDLRTPIDDLRAQDPALADNILRVSRALENAGSRAQPAAYTIDTTMVTKMSIQDEAHTHITLAQEWDHLLKKVRAIPQFEDFLRPASCSTLLNNLPESGPVVVVNIHQKRSDALVLMSGAKEPLRIGLPEFPFEQANRLRHQLNTFLLDSGVRMRGSERDDSRGPYVKTDNQKEGRTSSTDGAIMKDILYQLWTFVVKPILDNLGHCAPASKIPRIWWCVTGPLAFLPIHAAGLYAPAESTPGIYTSLSDFAVSSYTPTVRSITEKEQNSREVNLEKMGLLMISQPDTPNLRCIPGTTVEVEAIKGLLANHTFQYLCLESGDATVDRVKRDMNAYSCIHFACHATQDTTEPLQSGFYLYDGRLELSAIIKEHLKGADLAFLSACQTSTGDEKLSEEAVHLAGGMLAAGYRGVVATMWSIQDSYGPKIAEEFYKNLVSHGADDENGSKRLSSDGAAYALHSATQQARKTLGDSESALRTWVPFVHFGL